MNLDREIYAELRSFDSFHYFPDNQAASFKVQFDQELRFKGKWELSLRALSIDCPSKDNLNLTGQNLYIYTSIIDFSFVGGSLKQLLKRVSLGRPVRSGNRIIYQVNEADKGCCYSYYKPITTSHCLCVEVHIEDDNGKLVEFSPECEVTLSLLFRRTTEYSKH